MWDSTRGLALLLRHIKERIELESKKILYSWGYGRHLEPEQIALASPRKRTMEREGTLGTRLQNSHAQEWTEEEGSASVNWRWPGEWEECQEVKRWEAFQRW